MHLDRFTTLNVVQPVRRAVGAVRPRGHQLSATGSNAAVPVLMYHSISDEPEPGVSPYYRVNTSPAVFRQHIQFLADHNYRSISLEDLVSWLERPGPIGKVSGAALCEASSAASVFSPVALTFDDGFANFYTEAFPMLQEFGFTATVFLPTAFIGESRRSFAPHSGTLAFGLEPSALPACLTWSEVRELHRAGIRFGSHTVNHPKLVELDWPEIESEIADSKSEIEQHLGEGVTAFCYPYAFPQADRSFAGNFSELLEAAGYGCCTTTELGRARPGDDPYRLKRLPANSLDDLPFFAAKLDGSYDWLARPQALIKKLKRSLTRAKRHKQRQRRKRLYSLHREK